MRPHGVARSTDSETSSRSSSSATAPGETRRPETGRTKAPRVLRELHVGEVAGLIQPLMDEGDGLDAPLTLLQRLAKPALLELAALHVEETGDQLQVVLHPVVDLADEHVPLRHPPGQLLGALDDPRLQGLAVALELLARVVDLGDVDA